MPTLAKRTPLRWIGHKVEYKISRAGWLFEVKWDGYRAVAEVEKGTVRLYSRNFISYADKFASEFSGNLSNK